MASFVIRKEPRARILTVERDTGPACEGAHESLVQ
jgi:hypothetical protein